MEAALCNSHHGCCQEEEAKQLTRVPEHARNLRSSGHSCRPANSSMSFLVHNHLGTSFPTHLDAGKRSLWWGDYHGSASEFC